MGRIYSAIITDRKIVYQTSGFYILSTTIKCDRNVLFRLILNPSYTCECQLICFLLIMSLTSFANVFNEQKPFLPNIRKSSDKALLIHVVFCTFFLKKKKVLIWILPLTGTEIIFT